MTNLSGGYPLTDSSHNPDEVGFRRLSVALFTGSMRGGGAERAILTLATAFAERGVGVDLVLVKAEGEYLSMVPDSVRVVDLDSRRTLTAVLRFLSYVRRERPPVLLSTLLTTDLTALVAKLIRGRQLRVVIRQAITFTDALDVPEFRHGLYMRLVRLLMPVADAIVAVSDGVADDLRAQAPRAAGKIITIFNPVVSPDIFEQAAAPVEHPWFGDGGAPVVLAAGRLAPQKDYPTLLRGFGEVARGRAARLVILGQGPERESLLELAARLGIEDRFDLPGFDVNPFRYMARASVFVLSSRYEGFPNVLAQAMACGAPVVSTDCRSGPSEMLEGGRWGRLVPVGDWRAMARAIEDTLDDPMPAEELKARASVYSVEASVERYLEVLLGSGQ